MEKIKQMFTDRHQKIMMDITNTRAVITLRLLFKAKLMAHQNPLFRKMLLI